MRASPSVHVEVRHFGLWRGCVTLLAAAGGLSVVTWGAALGGLLIWPHGVALTACLLVLLGLAVSLSRIHPFDLRWDGQVWHLTRHLERSADAEAGMVVVCMDLGGWVLLRFDSQVMGSGRPRRVWLPVQRPGLESQWHGLRCALYSPRTDPGAQPDEI